MKPQYLLFLMMCLGFRATAQEDTVLETQPMVSDPPATFAPADLPQADDKIYRIRKGVDYPLIVGLGGTSIYMMTIIYNKDKTPLSTIQNLNKNNVPSIDRWTAGWHDANLDQASYYPFYGVMPLPLILLADKRIAADKGTIGLLYLESFAFEGIIYTSAVYFADRFRPDVYNTSLDLNYRTNGNFRNSFFAGHVAVVADATFFISTVYASYHPYSNLKWVLYGASTAATLGMAYMRLYAGKHFTSDIITGIVVGVGCGTLTPILHKRRDYRKQKWTMMPSLMEKGAGFAFTYKL